MWIGGGVHNPNHLSGPDPPSLVSCVSNTTGTDLSLLVAAAGLGAKSPRGAQNAKIPLWDTADAGLALPHCHSGS